MDSSLQSSPPMTSRSALTISELNNKAKQLLEKSFALVWVEGEISNFSQPASGHWYFSLKDSHAQIRSAMFRGRNQHTQFTPQAGMQVLACGRISLYEPRGDYQLIVERLEEIGEGALRRAFDQLKAKLNKEGLFEDSHKKPLPLWPKQIGVITSPTGAAIRDILIVLRRRFPAIPIIIYPTPVQGKTAAQYICQALAQAEQHHQCDVLILARGGGSLEDLWAFNDETLARAIFKSHLPIVTGIGHEVDFTIADFVADMRAATPSAAAELVSPEQVAIQQQLQQWAKRMQMYISQLFTYKQQQLIHLQQRLRHPRRQLEHIGQRLDDLERHLIAHMHIILQQYRARLTHTAQRLKQQSPSHQINQYQQTLQTLMQQMAFNIKDIYQSRVHRLAALTRALEAVSPLATLHRGYAIIRTYPGKQIITSTAQLKVGDTISAQVHSGHLLAEVSAVGRKD